MLLPNISCDQYLTNIFDQILLIGLITPIDPFSSICQNLLIFLIFTKLFKKLKKAITRFQEIN